MGCYVGCIFRQDCEKLWIILPWRRSTSTGVRTRCCWRIWTTSKRQMAVPRRRWCWVEIRPLWHLQVRRLAEQGMRTSEDWPHWRAMPVGSAQWTCPTAPRPALWHQVGNNGEALRQWRVVLMNTLLLLRIVVLGAHIYSARSVFYKMCVTY